jgi:hypothetical protein
VSSSSFSFQSLNVQAQVVLNSLAVTALARFDRIDVLENTARQEGQIEPRTVIAA